MALKSPQDLLTQGIKEIHSAEKQLSRAIPKLARAATSEKLREMLQRSCGRCFSAARSRARSSSRP